MIFRISSFSYFIFILSWFMLSSFGDGEPNTPVLQFTSSKIDFGVIKKGSNGSKKVSFSNQGGAPLIIIKCEGECSCTAVEWPKYAIQAGKNAELTIQYNTDLTGHFSKSISIYSNHRDGIYTLHVSGTVVE